MDLIKYLGNNYINVILLILFFFIIVIFIRISKINRRILLLKKKYDLMFSNFNVENIENLLVEAVKKQEFLDNKNEKVDIRLNGIESNLKNCFQKYGVVRFNAFDNVGSDQSFSVAMLNETDDGIVISGLFSRDSSCTFAKPIVSGNSKYPLSAEEIKAVDMARKKR